MSNYDKKHSRRISKEIDIDKVREGNRKEASAYLQRRNLTLNPVSSYICKVSGSLESFPPSSVLCPQITLSVFELSVSFHPSPYPLDTPTIIGLEFTFMYGEGVNRSTESSTEEPGNVSDWQSGQGSQNIWFSWTLILKISRLLILNISYPSQNVTYFNKSPKSQYWLARNNKLFLPELDHPAPLDSSIHFLCLPLPLAWVSAGSASHPTWEPWLSFVVRLSRGPGKPDVQPHWPWRGNVCGVLLQLIWAQESTSGIPSQKHHSQ